VEWAGIEPAEWCRSCVVEKDGKTQRTPFRIPSCPSLRAASRVSLRLRLVRPRAALHEQCRFMSGRLPADRPGYRSSRLTESQVGTFAPVLTPG
jgi:hypothetical protein